MMTRSQILYSSKPLSQSQIENPVKCIKTLTFCRKNGLVMQNYGLGIHSDKIWAYSMYNQKIPLKTTKLIWPICQLAKIFGIFKYLKKNHLVSVVRVWDSFIAHCFLDAKFVCRKLHLHIWCRNFLTFCWHA